MVAAQTDLEDLRAFLQTDELTPEERGRLETLVERAEGGDKVALSRIKQAAFQRGYQPVPGKDVPMPPGRLMACPEDPSHYQTFQREVGETLRCPVHDVPLVPGDPAD